VHGVVAELHLVGRRALALRRRELGVAARQLAACAAHLVPDAVDVVAAQQRGGGRAQPQVVTARQAALERGIGAGLAQCLATALAFQSPKRLARLSLPPPGLPRPNRNSLM